MIHIGKENKMKDKDINTYSRDLISGGIPYVQAKGINNSAYVYPESVEAAEEFVIGKKIKDKAREVAKRKGLIIYGNGHNVEPIVAHELGHARIANREGMDIGKINQNYVSSPFLKYVGAMSGSLAGGTIGGALGTTIGMPIPGAIAGSAVGDFVTNGVPQLVNEAQASNIANKYLDRIKGKDNPERQRERSVLKDAYKGYIYKAIIGAAMTGAVSGLLLLAKEKMKQYNEE